MPKWVESGVASVAHKVLVTPFFLSCPCPFINLFGAQKTQSVIISISTPRIEDEQKRPPSDTTAKKPPRFVFFSFLSFCLF